MNTTKATQCLIALAMGLVILVAVAIAPLLFSDSVKVGAQGESKEITTVADMVDLCGNFNNSIYADDGFSATMHASSTYAYNTSTSMLYMRNESRTYVTNEAVYYSAYAEYSFKGDVTEGNIISYINYEIYQSKDMYLLRINSVDCSLDGVAVDMYEKVTGRWVVLNEYSWEAMDAFTEVLPRGMTEWVLVAIIGGDPALFSESNFRVDEGVYTMRGASDSDGTASPIDALIQRNMRAYGIADYFTSDYDGGFEISLMDPVRPTVTYDVAMMHDSSSNEYSEITVLNFYDIGCTTIEFDGGSNSITDEEFLQKLGVDYGQYNYSLGRQV